MKRLIILPLLLLALLSACGGRPIDTIQGELYSQSFKHGFIYDIATYTLVGEKQVSGSDNWTMSTQWFYDFKARDGYPLILGQYYIFKAQHIENGEFILKSVEQVIEPAPKPNKKLDHKIKLNKFKPAPKPKAK